MSSTLTSSSWVRLSKQEGRTRLRLFCFPYAGGGNASFNTLLGNLPAEVEVCRIQLPGREDRIMEQPFTRLSPLIEALVEQITPYLTMPFSFFGYSMGALVCFELARQLQQLQLTPQRLFVCACRAPQLQKPQKPTYSLPEAEFVTVLRRLGGTAQMVLNNTELMQLLLPTIRADFAVCETYIYQAGNPFCCPISAYGGRQDSEVNHADLQGWSEQTISSFDLHMFDGGHFFLHEVRTPFLQMLSHDLSQLLLQLDENQDHWGEYRLRNEMRN